MTVNLPEETVKTGGEVYDWWDTESHGRVWHRIRKHAHADGRESVEVRDPKLIAKLDAAVDRAEAKQTEKEQQAFREEEAEHARQKGEGTRIYSEDGKKFFNIGVSQDGKNPDHTHVRLQVGGKWNYHFVLDRPDMDLFQDTVTGGRPRD